MYRKSDSTKKFHFNPLSQKSPISSIIKFRQDAGRDAVLILTFVYDKEKANEIIRYWIRNESILCVCEWATTVMLLLHVTLEWVGEQTIDMRCSDLRYCFYRYSYEIVLIGFCVFSHRCYCVSINNSPVSVPRHANPRKLVSLPWLLILRHMLHAMDRQNAHVGH